MKASLHNHKWLVALIVSSVVVVIIGMTLLAKKSSLKQQKDISSIEAMESIALYAQQQLEGTGSADNQSILFDDIKPTSSLERVAALKGRIPELGSDDWCEVMMVKDADAWTQDERSLFAEKCI